MALLVDHHLLGIGVKGYHEQQNGDQPAKHGQRDF
jgi:hypothetical protein